MLIQGDLQAVFDALYYLGVIDPVLEKDWAEAMDELPRFNRNIQNAITGINACKGNTNEMVRHLREYDVETLEYVAMEVAREFADFYARKKVH